MLDHIASLILLLLAAAGLFLQSGIPVGKPRRHLFAYYTNLSNLAVLIYELIFYFTGLAGYSGLYAFVRAPVPRYIMALAILVTNIIYHFFIGVSLQFAKGESDRKTKKNWLRMLTVDPTLCGGKEKYEDARTFIGNLLVHYVVPLLSFARWIAFAPKEIPFYATLIWVSIPILYFIFCYVRAQLGTPITESGNRYPYDLLSPDKLPLWKYFRNMVLLTAFYYLLGLFLYLIF